MATHVRCGSLFTGDQTAATSGGTLVYGDNGLLTRSLWRCRRRKGGKGPICGGLSSARRTTHRTRRGYRYHATASIRY